MYDLISGIIEHAWTSGASEQTTIYYICGALICLLVVAFVDIIRGIFHAFVRV